MQAVGQTARGAKQKASPCSRHHGTQRLSRCTTPLAEQAKSTCMSKQPTICKCSWARAHESASGAWGTDHDDRHSRSRYRQESVCGVVHDVAPRAGQPFSGTLMTSTLGTVSSSRGWTTSCSPDLSLFFSLSLSLSPFSLFPTLNKRTTQPSTDARQQPQAASSLSLPQHLNAQTGPQRQLHLHWTNHRGRRSSISHLGTTRLHSQQRQFWHHAGSASTIRRKRHLMQHRRSSTDATYQPRR